MVVVEPDCFSSPWFDGIRFQLALLGQRGPRPLKRKSSGKVHFYCFTMVTKQKGEKKKKRRNLGFVTRCCHESVLDCVHFVFVN